jgi:hypothetical protein
VTALAVHPQSKWSGGAPFGWREPSTLVRFGADREVEPASGHTHPETQLEYTRPHVEQIESGHRPWAQAALAVLGRLPRWVVVCLGVLLVCPSLTTGLVADDYFHALTAREEPGVRGLTHHTLDSFKFADGSEQRALSLMDEGILPWWADRQAVFAFFRPLASLSHSFDYRVWPAWPVLMHAQNLLWYAALLLLVAALFQRFSGRKEVAALSLLLFAIDDAHAPVVGWIANRNLLMALTLSLPALLLHDRFRRGGGARLALAAHGCFLLGLGAGEGSAMTLAYLVAYAAFLDRSSAGSRAFSMASYVTLFIAWRLLYNAFGYGVLGSGLYVDPGRSPVQFALGAVTRLPILLLGTVGFSWADFWEMYPLVNGALQSWVFGFALGFLGLLGWLLAPLWRSSAWVRFWLTGSVLSCLPACSAFPQDRLLLGPGIGAMAVLAELFWHYFQGKATRRGGWPRATVALLGVVHLGFAPLLALQRSASVSQLDGLLRAQDRTLPSTCAVRGQTFVLLNPPLDPFAAYFSVMRQTQGSPRPAHLYWLSTGVSELSVTTLDDFTLRLRPEQGFLSSSSQRMLRGSEHPLTLGQVVTLSDASFTVTELTSDGRPAEVRVRFRLGLRHASLRWFEWQGPGYVPFILPAPGETRSIPAVNLRTVFFG